MTSHDSPSSAGSPPTQHRTIAQFRTAAQFAVFGLLGLVVAGIGSSMGRGFGTVLTITGTCIGGMLLFVAVLILMLAFRWQVKVDEMLAGNYYVHWKFEPAQWQAYIAEQKRKLPRLWLIFGGLMLLAGLITAGLMTEDGNHIADQPLLTWTIIPLAGLLLGIVPGYIIGRSMQGGLSRMAAMPGEIFIGPYGFLMCSSYSPWNTAGQTLRTAKHQVGPPDAIVVTLEVFTGQTSVPKEISIPVPLGREGDVPDVVSKLVVRAE